MTQCDMTPAVGGASRPSPPLEAGVSADGLVDFMTEVWEDDPRGLWEEWHNARKVMWALGAVQVSHPKSGSGEAWMGFRLAGGERVFVQANGAGIRLSRWNRMR